MGTYTKYKTVTPNALAVDTDAYTDGDVVGGKLTIPLPGLTADGGFLAGGLLVDDAGQNAALTLYLFREDPSVIADDAAFEPTAADLVNLVSVISFATYSTVNANGYSRVTGINEAFAASGFLWGYLVADGSTPNYTAAGDLSLVLTVVSE